MLRRGNELEAGVQEEDGNDGEDSDGSSKMIDPVEPTHEERLEAKIDDSL